MPSKALSIPREEKTDAAPVIEIKVEDLMVVTAAVATIL
jgi:hypothetical protein